ncbi:MAG: DUF3293 domain-containing protein [Cyanobacteriota bacterium]
MQDLNKKNIEDKLLHFYYKTDYIIFKPKIIINIDKKTPKVDKILKKVEKNSWAYITAYNPMSILKTEEENLIAQKNLIKEIEKEFIFFEGEGKGENSEWKPEKSILIIGISKENAIEIGNKYNQKAIVFGYLNQKAKLILLN